jgi:hypothetical protein
VLILENSKLKKCGGEQISMDAIKNILVSKRNIKSCEAESSP